MGPSWSFNGPSVVAAMHAPPRQWACAWQCRSPSSRSVSAQAVPLSLPSPGTGWVGMYEESMATDTPWVAAMCRPSSRAPDRMPGGAAGGAGSYGWFVGWLVGRLAEVHLQAFLPHDITQTPCAHSLVCTHDVGFDSPGQEGRKAKHRSAPMSAAMPASRVALRAATLDLARRPRGAASSTCRCVASQIRGAHACGCE